MHRAVLLATILSAGPVSGQQAALDPVLRRLIEPEVRESIRLFGAVRPDAPPAEQPLGGAIVLDVDAAGRTRVGVLLELRSADALDALRALGAEIGSVIGSIATARIPLDVLPLLEDLQLLRVQAARTMWAQHDSSMSAIGVNAVRQHHAGTWTGSTGAGVIVGIIDSGIDLLHPDFHDAQGGSRVIGAWDQTVGGAPPPHFEYGYYCDAAAIAQVIASGMNAACPITDDAGHGTHVAGTAAGNGAAGGTQRPYAGVAPNADLLVVRAGTVSFGEDRVVDALLWLRDRGRALGRSVVANLSFGHHYGPHDGSALLEQVIDQLSAPGFLIVVAAGNSGVNDNVGGTAQPRYTHARLRPQPQRTDTLAFQVSGYSGSINGCNNFAWMSLWYDRGDELAVTVVRPNGTQVRTAAGHTGIGEDAHGRVIISNGSGLQRAHVAEAFIEIDGCGPSGSPAPGTWLVLVDAESGSVSGAPADFYIHTVRLGASGAISGTTGFDNSYVVGFPAAARRAITVGAFATRSCWPTPITETCYQSAEQTGDLARFSSGGPTRDGRLKPEITAPGIAVVSALSRTAAAQPDRVVAGGQYWALEGTSMATPHVTGALALLLQHRPSLSPEDVQDILSRAGRQDAFTNRTYGTPGMSPSAWWGYGKLDVPALLAEVLGGGTVVSVSIGPRADTLPRNGFAQLEATTLDAAGQTAYANVVWTTLDPGTAVVDAQGRVFGTGLGSARIVAVADVHADTALVIVVEPAVLAVSGAQASAPTNIREGESMPLLSVQLEAQGPEAVLVRRIAFEVTGDIPDVHLVLVNDANGNGRADDDEAVIHRTGRLNLSGTPRTVEMRLDTVAVERNGTRSLLLAAEYVTLPQHGSSFSASLLVDQMRTITLNSREEDRIRLDSPVIAAATSSTVLFEGEAFALSENPVRSGTVIFNFASVPTVAAVYTVTGARVADLSRRIGGLAYTWDLTNDDGRPVVPGIYLLVFQVGGDVVRRKLMVLTPAGGGP